jgi:hypothetical protein
MLFYDFDFIPYQPTKQDEDDFADWLESVSNSIEEAKSKPSITIVECIIEQD